MDPSLPAAGFLRRLAAASYDLLVLAGLLMLTSFVVIVARDGVAVPTGSRIFQLFIAAQAAVFFIALWSRSGQTPGMRAWHIRVETRDGRRLSPAIAARRFACALISAAALGLGFLWILIDAEGRAWHDRLSGTRVVRVPLLPAQAGWR